MAFDYSASAATAAALLDNFGQTVTLTRTTEPTYDPVTGTYTPGSTSTATAKAVLLPAGEDAGKQFGESGVVRVDDRKVIADAPFDEMTKITDAAGTVWAVVNAVALDPAGTAVLYKGFVRR